MKTLSDKEKEIITLIKQKKIFDIFSFVEHYDLGKSISHNRNEIENKFLEEFGDKSFECVFTRLDYSGNPLIEEWIDTRSVRAKAKVSHFGTNGVVLGTDQHMWGFDYYSPVYICENIQEILHFISIWEYLSSEGLIIELPKPFEQHDLGLFVRKNEIIREKTYLDELKEKERLYLSDMSVNAMCFMEWKFGFDEINFELCSEYLQKRIYPTLGLETFVSSGFKTKNDLDARRNFLIALTGIIVAVITSAVSIGISLADRGYHEELIKISDSLDKISEQPEMLEEMEQPELEENTLEKK